MGPPEWSKNPLLHCCSGRRVNGHPAELPSLASLGRGFAGHGQARRQRIFSRLCRVGINRCFLVHSEKIGRDGTGVGSVKSFLFNRRKAQRGVELRRAALQGEAAQESPINMQGIGQGKNEFELGFAAPAFDQTYRFRGNGTGRTDLSKKARDRGLTPEILETS